MRLPHATKAISGIKIILAGWATAIVVDYGNANEPSLGDPSLQELQPVVQVSSEFVIKPLLSANSDNSVALVHAIEEVRSVDASHPQPKVPPRFAELLKPMSTIQFASAEKTSAAPANAAGENAVAYAPIFMTNLGYPNPAPNRYPIPAKHNPIYFEDCDLERCGFAWGGAQTSVSAARFLIGISVFPFRALESPWGRIECDRLDCTVNCQHSASIPLTSSSKASHMSNVVSRFDAMPKEELSR